MNKLHSLLIKLALLMLIMMSCITLQAKIFTVNPLVKSILIPGWGQLSQGKSYGYVMLTSETLFWSTYFYSQTEQTLKDRASYEYALKFAHVNPGDYSSQYYRDLSKYNSSGFDAGGYNAMVRQTAIELFQYDPVAQQAYIDDNKYPDEMSWNWDSYTLRKKYSTQRKEILDLKDQAQVFTGLLIANHIISGIDMLRQRKHWNNVHPSIQYYKDTPILHLNIEF
jgi:hypothetical protein